MKKMMNTLMIRLMELKKDERGTESMEKLVWAVIAIVVAGLVAGLLKIYVPEIGELLINKVKGIFNL